MSDNFQEPGLLEANTVTYVEPYLGDLAPFNECSVCLGDHDEEIHAATLSVRSWFRDEVTKSFRIQPEIVV
jgi:hypothetical protein